MTPTDTDVTVSGINYIAISVTDLGRSLRFYCDRLGLELVERRTLNEDSPGPSGSSVGPVDVAVVRGPNTRLELIETAAAGISEPVAVAGPGFTHVCFQSPAEANLYSTLVDHGATEVSRAAPVDLGGYGVRYGYARDADGIMFEIEQLDEPPFVTPLWIAHVALVSPDIDRLVAFYERLLGVAPYRRANKITGPRIDEVTGLDDVHVRAAWFNAGNMVLELWEYVTPRTPEHGAVRPHDAPGYQRVVFEVGDLDREVERLAATGVEFLGAATSGGDGGGREVDARDPDGNRFGLVELPDASTERLDHYERITWM